MKQLAVQPAWRSSEAGLSAAVLAVRARVMTAEVDGPDGTYWSYTTVIADVQRLHVSVVSRDFAPLWVVRWQRRQQERALAGVVLVDAVGQELRGPHVPPSCRRRRSHIIRAA